MLSAEDKADVDEKSVLHTIDLLNVKLCDGSISAAELLHLFQLCMDRKKKEIAELCVQTGMFLCANSVLSRQQAFSVALAGSYHAQVEC
jgi:hypothetical protein